MLGAKIRRLPPPRTSVLGEKVMVLPWSVVIVWLVLNVGVR
jgi:hypothetical protein